MPIARPGRRLLQNLPLSFVARKVNGGGGRPLTASLSLTTMIDFLLVTVVFLLISFRQDQCAASNRVHLPPAENVMDMIDAPLVVAARSQVLVDGEPAGTTRSVEESKRMEKLDELSRALVKKRETWTQLHPGKQFPGAVILQIDQEVPSVVVKSMFRTAAFAGYPNVSFMVEPTGRN